MDLVLNNLQRLICRKTQTTKQPIKRTKGKIIFNFLINTNWHKVNFLLLGSTQEVNLS